MMRSIEDKSCQEPGNGVEGSFEFHRGAANGRSGHHRTALGKPTPSKWDDAQKWLMGLSRNGELKSGGQAKAMPRNSNADDLRLIAPVPQREQGCSSGGEDEEDGQYGARVEVHTKKVECDDESIWRINKPSTLPGPVASPAMRSICVRDMGTEMTPIASQEPSRTGTPIRASTPVGRSPVNSRCSTSMRCNDNHQHEQPMEGRAQSVDTSSGGCLSGNSEQPRKMNALETRAVAWDEAERAKYMARYKREEVTIQAWENHEKRKAEAQMKKKEVNAERMKARAQEKLTSKLVSTRRIAEEKRANAEAKLNDKAVRTSEKADYIRKTGHLPSSFSLKLPSFCW